MSDELKETKDHRPQTTPRTDAELRQIVGGLTSFVLGLRDLAKGLEVELGVTREELLTAKVLLTEHERGDQMLLDLLTEKLGRRPATIAEGIRDLWVQLGAARWAPDSVQEALNSGDGTDKP